MRGVTHSMDGDCVYGCPRTYGRKYGEKWASVRACACCRFCMGRTDDEIYCFGREGIPFPQDIFRGIAKETFSAADEGNLRKELERARQSMLAAKQRETCPSMSDGNFGNTMKQRETYQSVFDGRFDASMRQYSADLSGLSQAMEDCLAFQMLREKMGICSRQSLLNIWKRANNEWHVKTDSCMTYGFQSFLASLVVELFPEDAWLEVTSGEHAMLQAGIDMGSGERLIRFFVDGEDPYPVPERCNIYDIGQSIRWETVTLDRFMSMIDKLK